jgi:hypothetical protein
VTASLRKSAKKNFNIHFAWNMIHNFRYIMHFPVNENLWNMIHKLRAPSPPSNDSQLVRKDKTLAPDHTGMQKLFSEPMTSEGARRAMSGGQQERAFSAG